MGTWGIKPLENDKASDFKLDFEESGKDVNLLEKSFEEVLNTEEGDYLEADVCEIAVASSEILNGLSSNEISDDDRKRLIEKSNNALRKILENSELKELWEENKEDFVDWVKSVEDLIK